MKKTISVEWLEAHCACEGAIIKFRGQGIRDTKRILRILAKQHRWPWALWLLLSALNRREYNQYANRRCWDCPSRKKIFLATCKMLKIRGMK